MGVNSRREFPARPYGASDLTDRVTRPLMRRPNGSVLTPASATRSSWLDNPDTRRVPTQGSAVEGWSRLFAPGSLRAVGDRQHGKRCCRGSRRRRGCCGLEQAVPQDLGNGSTESHVLIGGAGQVVERLRGAADDLQQVITQTSALLRLVRLRTARAIGLAAARASRSS